MSDLTAHDKAILNCIFNPNLPLSDCYQEELTEEIEDHEIDTAKYRQANLLELEAVQTAENGNFDQSLSIFEEAIELAPDKASLYNNRAQVYQFKNSIIEAYDDLTRAIQLSENGLRNKTLRQALCQRGLIYRKREEIESARGDFEKAAKLGSKFAKSQLIELNPYAALCNQMLRKVMEELK